MYTWRLLREVSRDIAERPGKAAKISSSMVGGSFLSLEDFGDKRLTFAEVSPDT